MNLREMGLTILDMTRNAHVMQPDKLRTFTELWEASTTAAIFADQSSEAREVLEAVAAWARDPRTHAKRLSDAATAYVNSLEV